MDELRAFELAAEFEHEMFKFDWRGVSFLMRDGDWVELPAICDTICSPAIVVNRDAGLQCLMFWQNRKGNDPFEGRMHHSIEEDDEECERMIQCARDFIKKYGGDFPKES